jgi:uncharacterized protein
VREPPAIDAFGPGGFRVAGVWRPGSLLIIADEPRAWRPQTFADVAWADLADVIALDRGAVEFVLLGTGAVQALPSRAIREGLREAGLGLEFMATEAAAKLYNVLASEGRLFAAALIAL